MFMKGTLLEEKKKSYVMNWNVELGNIEKFEFFFIEAKLKWNKTKSSLKS